MHLMNLFYYQYKQKIPQRKIALNISANPEVQPTFTIAHIQGRVKTVLRIV